LLVLPHRCAQSKVPPRPFHCPHSAPLLSCSLYLRVVAIAIVIEAVGALKAENNGTTGETKASPSSYCCANYFRIYLSSGKRALRCLLNVGERRAGKECEELRGGKAHTIEYEMRGAKLHGKLTPHFSICVCISQSE
jgi:hypothetical protein